MKKFWQRGFIIFNGVDTMGFTPLKKLIDLNTD